MVTLSVPPVNVNFFRLWLRAFDFLFRKNQPPFREGMKAAECYTLHSFSFLEVLRIDYVFPFCKIFSNFQPCGYASGDHTLLSISDSYILPLYVTLSPFIYGFVLSGCSHSGMTSGSGISTFAHKEGASVGVHVVCAVCACRHLYRMLSYLTLSPTAYDYFLLGTL